MPSSSHQTGTPSKDTVSRRDFLRVGGLSFVGLSVAERAALAKSRKKSDRRSCIFLLMTGGPSQLDTFDPKPDAPAEVRGPLKSISTAIPGIAFCEAFPRLAKRAKQLAVIRSLHHDAAPIHETGLQLIQTGQLAQGDFRPPSLGSLIANTLGPRGDSAPYVVLPQLLSHTGVNTYRGQGAGSLGEQFEPVTNSSTESASGIRSSEFQMSESERKRYGDTRFGQLCLQARQLIECGVRYVTVNLFDQLREEVTWDCHGKHGTSQGTLYDYRDSLGPKFDQALSGLLDDLGERNLLDETLVVATGEFGRTPRVNLHGGRDHWPSCWSALLAGGGVQGGQVIGASDAHARFPVDRPVSPQELVASISDSLGVKPPSNVEADDEDSQNQAMSHISELFGGSH
ncbi:MAG: DUF1501 domain-containing protein [Planctomycetaceae bacterium]